MERLEAPVEAMPGFETYKNHPAFLQAADVFPLPFVPGETTDNASGESGRSAVSGLEAEAAARAEAGSCILLSDTLALAFQGRQVITCCLNTGATASCHLSDVILSMARAAPLGSTEGDQMEVSLERELVLLSTESGMSLLEVSLDGQLQVLRHCACEVPRLYLSAAAREETSAGAGAVRVLAYSVKEKEVEMLALQVMEDVQILWRSSGAHPPQGAVWAPSCCIMLACGFPDDGLEEPTLSVLRVPSLELESRKLPRGDLLACAPHGGVLHVALSSGTAGGALLFHLHRRSPWLGEPSLLPAAGACRDVRGNVLMAVAPDRSCFALVERDMLGVSLFGSPQGRQRAPMATVSTKDLAKSEPVQALLSAGPAGQVLLRTRTCLVRCRLNSDAQVEGVKRELISREDMPLGMDPKALLKMLDTMGED
ncbi:unnamed protein product [Effrenium voratum]|uniref:Uncharacterized protein n=1 Tax=Effrenium voratum TaxID=2562239 RepID=A0AA36NLV7_9DINO|nr:unnamed protein product [Effrenium voratum]CAJ1421266.1 unnamed protein product [Effrenium voratum]